MPPRKRAKTKPRPIEDDVLDQCARSLKVLAHPLRLRMVELLLREHLSVGELAGRLDLPPAAVSQHLGQMLAQGLLSVERKGRLAYYRASNPHAVNVIRCIQRHNTGR